MYVHLITKYSHFLTKQAVPGPGHYQIKSQFEVGKVNEAAKPRPSFGAQAKVCIFEFCFEYTKPSDFLNCPSNSFYNFFILKFL